jgi:hypothetical protein
MSAAGAHNSRFACSCRKHAAASEHDSTLQLLHLNHAFGVQAQKLPKSSVNKADRKYGFELLMRFCAARNVAPTAVASPEFNQYVEHISKHDHNAPSRFYLMLALEDLCKRLDAKKATMLGNYNCIGFAADSWTKAGRHITALTAGNPGSSFYLSSYENLGSDNAATSADAIHQCMLSALGLPTDLSPQDSRYQQHKVAIFTSDTTNVMPATNKALNKFALFKGCSWVPCFSHVGNLALLDQLKIPSIAKLLSHAK